MRNTKRAGLVTLVLSALGLVGASAVSAQAQPSGSEKPKTEASSSGSKEFEVGSFGYTLNTKPVELYSDKIIYSDTVWGKVPKIERSHNVVLVSSGVTAERPFRLWSDSVSNRTTFTAESDSGKTVFVDNNKDGLDKVVDKVDGVITEYDKEQIESDAKTVGSDSYQKLFGDMSYAYLSKELGAMEKILGTEESGKGLIWYNPAKGFAYQRLTQDNQTLFVTYEKTADGYSFSMRAVPLNSGTSLENLSAFERNKQSLIDLRNISSGYFFDLLQAFGENVNKARSVFSKTNLESRRNLLAGYVKPSK